MASSSHIGQAEVSHLTTFTARFQVNASTIEDLGIEDLEREDLEIEIYIKLHIHLNWATDFDIYQYLLLSRNARHELFHHVFHIQELFPTNVFINHPTFSAPLLFSLRTTDDFLCRRLRDRVYNHQLYLNRGTPHR